MVLLKDAKLVLLLITINSYSLIQQNEAASTDTKFKSLEACLISAGVESDNIIYRDNGNKYAELNFQWNTLNGYVKPLAYLIANSVSDIQNAVICSQSSNVRIVARSGGHSYVKNSFGDSNSLIVDLTRMNKISLDPTQMSCEVGAGARNGQVNSILSKKKFLIPTGICPRVGVTGLSLGGGWGYFTRQYGLTSDSIIELEMVDAQGKLLVINNSTNEDLFFALRGGGGGSYGIVTKIKFKMYPAPNTIIHGKFEYDFLNDFVQFYQAWQVFITKIPKHIGTLVILTKNVIHFEIFYINLTTKIKDVSAIYRIINSFAFPVVTNRTIKAMSQPDFLLSFSQPYSDTLLTDTSQLADIKENHVGWKKVKSFFVNKKLDKKAIYKYYKLLGVFLKRANIALLQNGGAIEKFSRTETAFVHRGHLYDAQMWAFNAEGEDLKGDEAMKAFYEASKEVLNHRESYQNYLDQDIDDYLDRYYAENLRKLIRIKNRVDPENVFHHPMSIPVK